MKKRHKKQKAPVHELQPAQPPEPTDFSDNGACSRCGGCCASILPLSLAELNILKQYALDRHMDPALPDGADVIYMHCPFLERLDNGKTACLAYDVRPAVCKSFSCHNSNSQNAQAWIDQEGDVPLPEPDNMWRVFNKTGLRIDGTEVPFDKAPLCQITTSDGGAYRFQIGRPASFLLEDGRLVPPGIVTGLYKNGIQMFDNAAHEIVFIEFTKMAQVLSGNCIVAAPGPQIKAMKEEEDAGQ